MGSLLRWILATPLMVLTTVVVAVGILGTSLSVLLADAETPKRWLTTSGVYEQGVDIAFDATLANQRRAYEESPDEGVEADRPTFDEALKDQILSLEEARQTLHEVVTPEYLQQQVEAAIDALYAYLRGETETPEIVVDVVPLRDRGRAALGTFLKSRVAALPTCAPGIILSVEQIQIFEKDACLPLGTDLALVDTVIDQEIQNLPLFTQDTIALSDLGDEAGTGQAPPLELNRFFGLLRAVPYLFALLLLLLVSLLMVLVPHRRGKGVAIGILIGFPAAAVGALVLRARSLGETHLNELLAEQIDVAIPGVVALLSRTLTVALQDMTQIVLSVSGVLVAVAIAAIILGFSRHHKASPRDSVGPV